jgi:RNA polymerase sigma factor (sigma-70 family)
MHVEPRSAGSPTPSQLLASCGVIERVYLEHSPLLRRVAVRKFGIPPLDADTLVHDVFAAYIANPGAVRSDLRAYLIAAICNASRNYWRSKEMQERVFVATGEPAEDSGLPDESFFEGLSLHLVMSATLARLGQRCRDVLRRFYFEGESAGSIAEVLETTPGNVHYILHACRKKARSIYDELTRVRS